MGERLTPKGRKLLQQREINLRQKFEDATLVYGNAAGFGDGDGYHDETANLLEGEVRKSRGFLETIRKLLRQSEELRPPKQFEKIELGHRIGVELLDDEDIKGIVHVTILSFGDSRVLSEEFDQTSEILVSDKSPLGSSLLGKKVREETKYSGRRAFIESIDLAKVFNDETE